MASASWAPMQAADCLLKGHALEVREELDGWVTDPALKGLGRLVLVQLDTLPLEVAVPVAKRALAEGPDPSLAKERILGHGESVSVGKRNGVLCRRPTLKRHLRVRERERANISRIMRLHARPHVSL